MKESIKAILTHLCALVVVLLILGNIVQYVQCKVHLETVLYLQKEIQHQQELTSC